MSAEGFISSSPHFQTQNKFLLDYVSHRSHLLLQLLEHNALIHKPICINCQGYQAIYRCKDCFTLHLTCRSCCVTLHVTLPFHCIQKWTGTFFEHSDLNELGFIMEIAHESSVECYPPDNWADLDRDDNAEGDDDGLLNNHNGDKQAESNLVVITSTGVFSRKIRWCWCASTPDQCYWRIDLLLQEWLFPASFKVPETVFTFEVFDHFRVDALECKTAALNFMNKLKRITNEAFPHLVPVG